MEVFLSFVVVLVSASLQLCWLFQLQLIIPKVPNIHEDIFMNEHPMFTPLNCAGRVFINNN
jgi:hypothetical protein